MLKIKSIYNSKISEILENMEILTSDKDEEDNQNEEKKMKKKILQIKMQAISQVEIKKIMK